MRFIQNVTHAGMTAEAGASKKFEDAFRAANLLTGSAQLAERAVLDGIGASGCHGDPDEALFRETIKAAIRLRDELPASSERALSRFPWELRRLGLLDPIPRDCLLLRIVLGISARSSAAMLRLTIQEIEDELVPR